MLLTFCSTSALASSISSRIKSEAFSETWVTRSPSDLSSGGGSKLPSATKAAHQPRQQNAADEGGSDDQLRVLGERLLWTSRHPVERRRFPVRCEDVVGDSIS